MWAEWCAILKATSGTANVYPVWKKACPFVLVFCPQMNWICSCSIFFHCPVVLLFLYSFFTLIASFSNLSTAEHGVRSM